MTENTQPQTLPAKAGPAKAMLATGGKVAAIVPQNIEQSFRLAEAIAKSGFAPKSYGNDPTKIMVGILHGMEIGLTPMAALQSIAVINGMPSVWGDGALALVRASGLLEWIEEKFEARQGGQDKFTAVCTVKRVGEPAPISREFSVEDAKKSKLWTKQGPWQEYPKRMLQMRARALALRDGFADVLRGVAITEEVRDMGTLEQGADGSYAPPRPKRQDYKPSDEEIAAAERDMDRQFAATIGGTVVDDDGVVQEEPSEDAGPEPLPEAAQQAVDAMQAANDFAALQKVWNGLDPETADHPSVFDLYERRRDELAPAPAADGKLV